ncbi:MAG TPA: hypothetical protein VEJ47_15980 [Candidatus Eremiobacteraceae bacterium]|nr:hypothetical protein [Candidatus Eremiobacteraceae bacterium]
MRAVWISSSLALCLLGALLIFASLRTSGNLADAGILLGGTLIALALFPLSMLSEQRTRARKLARHMRHSHHGPSTRLTGDSTAR